jgi:hypothetical protein
MEQGNYYCVDGNKMRYEKRYYTNDGDMDLFSDYDNFEITISVPRCDLRERVKDYKDMKIAELEARIKELEGE